MEQRNRRETEIIKGKHFNLKSVLELFRCVLVFAVNETIPKTNFKSKCFPLFISISLLVLVSLCFSSVSLLFSYSTSLKALFSPSIILVRQHLLVFCFSHIHFSLPTLGQFSYTPTLHTHNFFHDSTAYVFKCFNK